MAAHVRTMAMKAPREAISVMLATKTRAMSCSFVSVMFIYVSALFFRQHAFAKLGVKVNP
jgi:hypothetical protein